ncbi:hypothetical protein QJQ45_028096 [Haematococcus lacustris]|nr:hypothetical protein QJQ45_028096 [Haematococcus lacustris]
MQASACAPGGLGGLSCLLRLGSLVTLSWHGSAALALMLLLGLPGSVMPVCAGVRALEGVTALQRRWHPACFVCGFCEEAINQGGNTQFAIGAQDGWPYHMDCFRHRFHPVCHICQQFIPERPDGRVEYKEQAFWREPYCTHHLQDGTPQCCSCSRFQGKGVEFVQLSEGRFLCLTCLGSVVLDTKDVQPLYEEVMAFYRSMGMAHPVKAPLMMVDGTTLNEYSNREGKDSEGGPVFHIRGLTLATVYRTIPSIMRTSGDLGVSSVSTPVKAAGGGGGSVKCSVSAILVLYGLPRLLTGCIIAHELMHAWLRMKNVAGLDQQVEEGLCQLMAYVWLDQQHGQQKDPEQQRLGSFFAYQIREDTSAVYGDGFRTAYDAFQQRGLTAIINDRFSKPLKTLGEGTYGTVYLCVDKAAPDGPCYVAIKSFKSQELEEQAKALAVREAKLLAAVRGHPNIVHLHHAYMTRSGQLYLVQEYVENSLAQQLEVHSPKGLPHGMACSIIRQLLEALAFMHSRSVTHRDIKMANVLLRNDGCVKLCDFGMATSLAPAVQPGGGPGGLQPSDSTAEAQLTSYVVTRWYRSPEVLLEQPYNEGVDVWSVGCLFAELLFNRPLYPGRSHIDQLALVAAGTAMILPEHLATLRANYRMCGVDIPLPQPSTAQGATQLQQQAAVYQRMSGMLLPAMREFLAATLHPDPLLRATAAELLQLPIMQTAQRVPAVPGPSLPPAAAVLKQLEEAEAAKAEATGQATGAKQPVVKPSRSMRRGVEEGVPAAVPAEQRCLASVRCEPEASGFSASRAACVSPPPPHSLSPMLASRHADKVDGQRSPSALRAIHDPNRSRTPDRSLLRVPSAGRRSSQSPLVVPPSQSPATSRHASPACRHSYTPNGRPTSARPLRGQSDLNTRLLRSSLSSTSVVIEGSGAGNAIGHGVEVQAAVPGLRAPVSGRRSHMQHSAGLQAPDSSSAAKEGLSLASLLLPARSPGREARNGPAPWDETEGKSAGPSSCEHRRALAVLALVMIKSPLIVVLPSSCSLASMS